MKLTKQQRANRVRAGKMGARVSHKKRYEILEALSALVDPVIYPNIVRWETDKLKVLLKELKKWPQKKS